MLTTLRPLARPLHAIAGARSSIFFAQFGSWLRRRSRGGHRRCLHNKGIVSARLESLPNLELS